MPATYDLGDSIRLTFTVRDITGVLVDATTVGLTVTRPDATTFTPLTPTHPGVGTYQATLSPDAAGTWLYRWIATGTAVTTEDGQFYVAANAGGNVYTTLAELKAALSVPATDTADDEDLTDAILAASRAVDGDCRRHFYRLTDTRTFEAADPYGVRLGAYMDLVSVTSLKTDTAATGTFATTWAAGDYQLLCQDGTPNTLAGPEPRPYQRIRAVGTNIFPMATTTASRSDLVQIVGVWGWPAVPDRIRRATRMMAAEQFKMRDAPFGAIGMADLGIIRVRENPKYLRLINDYRLMEAAVPFA